MNFNLTTLNWLAIAVVAVGTLFLGGLWYTVLGPVWIRLNGYTPEQVKAMQAARPPAVFFGGMLASYLLFAVFLAVVLQNMAVPTAAAAALAGVALWLALAVPIAVTGWLASNKHFGVYAIDLAFQFVFIVAASVVLATWR